MAEFNLGRCDEGALWKTIPSNGVRYADGDAGGEVGGALAVAFVSAAGGEDSVLLGYIANPASKKRKEVKL